MDENQTSQGSTVRAKQVRQVRLMRTEQRPQDALLELTTKEGPQHFLIPLAALPELARKLEEFGGSQGESNTIV